MNHLNKLVVEIGERPVGTPAYHQAAAYIRQIFQSAGLEMQEVCLDFPNWSLLDSSLSLNGQSLAVDVNPFSPACDVTAPMVAVSTLTELHAANITDKIALLYGDLTKSPVFPMNFEHVQFERDQTINRLLIEKSPEAILAVNLHPTRRIHIFEDEDFPLPSATVTTNVGRELLLNTGEQVHLRISTHTEPSQAVSIIGRRGSGKRIVLCAHYDTKFGTPGAYDNGTGMAAILELIETLDASVSVEFIAWGDEEYGAHTDLVYAKQTNFNDILCAINLDAIGLLTENTSITMFSHSPAFEHAIHQITADYPAVVWIDPWIQSNHFTFFSRGVPTIALSSLTFERTHQADDSIEWVNPQKVDESIALVKDIIKLVQSQAADWTRDA